MMNEGWKEAAIAWEVCASIHREYAKGNDAFFKTRQNDFVNAANKARVKAQAPTPPVQHSDDVAVDRFAAAMKAKLAQKRAEGRGGWNDPEQCPVERLAGLLHQHVGKGDPVDVANFAMMLWCRGGRTTPPAQQCEPAGWLDGPYGEFRRNPAFKVTGPGSVAWSLPVFLAPPVQQDDESMEVLRALVEALENAFISSWQSTAAWQEQLDSARALLTKRGAA